MDSGGQCCIQLTNEEASQFGDRLSRAIIEQWLVKNGYTELELEDIETRGQFSLHGCVLNIEYEDSEWLAITQRLLANRALPIAVRESNEYGGVSLLAKNAEGVTYSLDFEQESEEMESSSYLKTLIAYYQRWRSALPETFIDLELTLLTDDIIACLSDADSDY